MVKASEVLISEDSGKDEQILTYGVEQNFGRVNLWRLRWLKKKKKTSKKLPYSGINLMQTGWKVAVEMD